MDMDSAIDVLARTAWAEARGDGYIGMQAVASVVLRRAAYPRWWGCSVISVCLAPWQFSCWNSDDPNLPKLRAATDGTPMFATALLVAERAIAGELTDQTGGADSYFAVGSPVPSWADPDRETCVILHHRFYRIELPRAPGNLSMHGAWAVATDDSATDSEADSSDESADDLNAAELARLAG